MDWKTLGGQLFNLGITGLGTVLGGPAGTVIGGAVGSVISSAIGVENTPDAIGAAITNDTTGTVLDKVRQVEVQNGEAFNDLAKAYIGDVQDARQYELGLVDKGSLIAWEGVVYRMTIVIGFFVLLFWLVGRSPEFPNGLRDILSMFFGLLIGEMKSVGNYINGSSQSSANKERLLASQPATTSAAVTRAVKTVVDNIRGK